MSLGPEQWVGVDESSGLPSMERPDSPRSRWSLQAIAATERPVVPTVSPDGSMVAFILHRDTSDLWMVPVSGGLPTRLTTDRGVHIYWWETRPAWSPDGTRLAHVSEGACGWLRSREARLGGCTRATARFGSMTRRS